jgi:hypothetical protein
MKNADKIVFRASSMKDIMTGVKKGWNVENSLTCKRKLVQVYREIRWRRETQIGNKYTDKGLQTENDGITLYSRVKKQLYKKNTERLTNDFFTGEVDLFQGPDIRNAEVIIDNKSPWNWMTFPSMLDTESSDYIYQGQTYMDLTGAKKFIVAHCLVNTPAELILDEMRRLQWKMNVLDPDNNPEYLEACKEIERNCIVDSKMMQEHYPHYDFKNDLNEWIWDIPMEERVHEIVIDRDDALIGLMKARVIECREWLNDNLYR